MKAAKIFTIKGKQIGHLKDRFPAALEAPIHEIQATKVGKKRKWYSVISLLSNLLLPQTSLCSLITGAAAVDL